MAETLRGRLKLQEQSISSPQAKEQPEGSLQSRYPTTETDGWTKFDKPVVYIYAGKGPYVGRCEPINLLPSTSPQHVIYSDYMAFPASFPDDGLVDIVAHSKVRTRVLKPL